MKPLGEKDSESDAYVHNLLATLRDHFGSVNCVRWAKCGQLIASGSDDHIVLVHEKRPGSGTTEFGSGEPPDIENWKVILSLRGHTADVVLPFPLLSTLACAVVSLRLCLFGLQKMLSIFGSVPAV